MRPSLRSLRSSVAAAAIIAATAAAALAQREMTISQVQGDKNVSPVVNSTVRVSGIVTARTRTGFFIQTPDDKTDNDPKTSEGIFVFTRSEPSGEATIGNLVTVAGRVEEFRPRADPWSLPITELSWQSGRDELRVVSKGNALPKPVALTADDFRSQTIDQIERLEGMRVAAAELTVVAPTGGRVDGRNAAAESDGVFYAVTAPLARPFREPGLDVYEYIFLDAGEKERMQKDHPKMTLFDANPERLRIESAGQLGGQPLDVTTFSAVKNVTGVLHYGYRTYSILLDPDARPVVSGGVKPLSLPEPGPRQFVVATMNLENLFDDQDDPSIKEEIVTTDAFNRRLRKISATVRELMRTPDVIGVVEAENHAALKRLADRINTDAVAAGKPDPKYEAFLIDGNDGRGIDNGFLVKTSRVKVVEIGQFGKDDKFKDPESKDDVPLNDRPPLMLRASVEDAKAGRPFEFTVVVNHLKSFLGYNDPKQMQGVRLKKKLQAEFLARWIDARQKADPAERIILVGDFNFYQFNDGIMDVIGTIKGKPAAKDQVLVTSDDLVARDLYDLVDSIEQKQRYSYVFGGNAQVLDHVIVSATLARHVAGFGYVRVNADQPESMRGSDSRVERFSDHDPAAAYFNLDEKQ
ncbi:MAG: hypothetical protein ACK4S4_02075 [Pyrinomonadaceae bacterium]